MQESLVLEMLETGKTATWPANSGVALSKATSSSRKK